MAINCEGLTLPMRAPKEIKIVAAQKSALIKL